MHRNFFRLLFLFLTCLSLTHCKKEDVPGPAGPAGVDGPDGSAVLTGTIHGKIKLYDTLSKAIPDFSAVTVTVDNAVPAISLITTADGSFSSSAFPAGMYTLTATKPGYGTMKLPRFQNTGGKNSSETGFIELGAMESSWSDINRLVADTVNDPGGARWINLTVILAHPHNTNYTYFFNVYLSDSPGASNSKNQYVYHSYPYQLNDSTLIMQNFNIPLYLYSLPLYDAQYLYMAVAIDQNKAFTYTDDAGNMVFPSAGKLSNEVKVYNYSK